MANEDGRVLAFPQAPDTIELRHLRAFVAVAEELNFSHAADRLHISPSALSRQIRAFEDYLGCELLRRSTHRVELTIAGEALLDRTPKLLDDVDEALTVTQAVGGELAARLTQLWMPLFAAARGEAGLEGLRRAYEDFHAQFWPPPEVTIKPVNAGGVAAFELSPQARLEPSVLYLHGGGHFMGSAFGHQPLIGALVAASGANVLAPEYRLAPEHPFPAGRDDAIGAYRWMLERGTPARRVALVGDSSGAGLAMSVLLALSELGLPLPGGVVHLCPWIDLTGSTIRNLAGKEDERRLLMEQMIGSVAAYLGGHAADDPAVNALYADLRGMPPMLIQGATGDLQREDAHLLTERARAAGVDVRLELYPVDTHGFQMFWSFLPEAMEALSQAGRFVSNVVAGAEAHRRDRGASGDIP